MAGLLAWAADVVTGNGQQQQHQDDEEELPWRGVRLQLSTEEQEEVRQLEERATSLQQAIQHLRLRIPPPDISRRLPQLHADSLAAHSAFTSELNAHQATQTEAQDREALLHAENAAYSRAIISVREQLQRKRQEIISLNARLQALQNEEAVKSTDLHAFLRSSVQQDSVVSEGIEKADLVMQSTDQSFKEGEELQKTRAELTLWETKVEKLNQDWLNLLQNSTRWPSAAQREKELERRLRILSEQLVAKQGQADTLAKDLGALQLRLSKVTETHRHGIATDTEESTGKGKTRKTSSAVSSSATSESLVELSKSFFHAAMGESDRPLLESVKRIPQQIIPMILHLWSSRKHMCTPTAIRCFIVFYIFILQAIPFVMIFSATSSR